MNCEQNDKKKSNEQFILLINNINKESAFLSATIYVGDSLQRANPDNFMNYGSEFSELVVTSNNTIDVFEDIIDYKYRYTETEKLKWEILKEKRKLQAIIRRTLVVMLTDVSGMRGFQRKYL